MKYLVATAYNAINDLRGPFAEVIFLSEESELVRVDQDIARQRRMESYRVFATARTLREIIKNIENIVQELEDFSAPSGGEG